MPQNKENNLISIDEVIFRAKKRGVDFGKGNPRERLRYLTKIGLLPHAKRKSFNGRSPNGAYPEYVIELLVEIDQKLKLGKSIQEIKREKEEKILTEVPYTYYPPTIEVQPVELKPSVPKTQNSFRKIADILKIIFLVFISIGGIFFFTRQTIEKNFSNFLASLVETREKLTQRTTPTLPKEKSEEFFPLLIPEPYLTINAETDINAPLNLKNKEGPARLSFFQDQLQGTITLGNLTENQTYTLPDQTGTICLTSGNCFGLFGEVSVLEGMTDRLAKFIAPRKIGNSSISDSYEGVLLYITTVGNVGIGTANPTSKLEVIGDIRSNNLFAKERLGIGVDNPQYALQVKGRIQASGDICTELAGGRCLSTLPLGAGTPPAVAAGISGSGTAGYLAKWIEGTTLRNSLLYDTGLMIGIGTTTPNERLTITGALSLAEIEEPEKDSNFGKIYVGLDGKLYFKNETGQVFDLTADTTGIGGAGKKGQLAFWNSASSISGDDDFFWDIDNKRLGIGTNAPVEKLEVVGTIKMTGFQLTTGAGEGRVLVSDNLGIGSWQSLPPGTMPPGSFGQTMRHDGSNWIATSFLYNSGTRIGIGTTNPTATLSVNGDMNLAGPLKITSSLAQLLLQYDSNNYLSFAVSQGQTLLVTSGDLIINSLTGKIYASGSTVSAASFFSDDASVRKSGEMVLRGAIPIYRFGIPAQTSSTNYAQISKHFEGEIAAFPPPLGGTTRKYAFLINSADNIPTNQNSEWRIYRPGVGEYTSFTLPGLNMSSLEEGLARIKYSELPANNWQLEVRVPSGRAIRIFNIFLLAFDQLN